MRVPVRYIWSISLFLSDTELGVKDIGDYNSMPDDCGVNRREFLSFANCL